MFIFQNGGMVQKQIANTANFSIDYDLLASKIAEANANLPNPIVLVEDVNAGQESVTEVLSGANI